MTPALLLALLLPTAGPLRWESRPTGATARLRGLCVVEPKVVWASGTGGTFVRTSDGGETWTTGVVPGASELDFRDVEAFDGRTAVLLSSGPGGASRIYRTEDAGASWSLRFTNPDADGFLDAIAFWDASRGLAFGDPVGGKFRAFMTDDGGKAWRPLDGDAMPSSLPNEGAFAASGTCLVALAGTKSAWFATGGARASRAFRTEDAGASWSAADTPVTAGNPASGIFSVAFRDASHGLAIGGDFKAPDAPGPHLAETADGGRTWSLVPGGPRGYRSGVAFVPGLEGRLVAVGPGGSNLSTDGGRTWSAIGADGFHAVAARGTAVWASGDDGRVARLVGD